MRHLLLLLLLFPLNIFGQANDFLIIGYYFEFTENTEIIELDASSVDLDALKAKTALSSVDATTFEVSDTAMYSAESGTAFKVLKRDSNIYIIKIINVKDAATKFYGITEFQLINNAKLYDGKNPKNGFVSSAITIPIKIRFGKESEEPLPEGARERLFDFEGNYNIGVTAGYRIRTGFSGNNYVTFLGGFNIGNTKVTSETADVTADSNQSIFTPFIGGMFEIKDFQIGAFWGWDHVSGSLSKSWVYQGKPWLGLGIGYNIFTSKDNAATD